MVKVGWGGGGRRGRGRKAERREEWMEPGGEQKGGDGIEREELKLTCLEEG